MDYSGIIQSAASVIATLIITYFTYIRKRIGAVDKLSTTVHGDEKENKPGLVKTVDKLTTTINGDATADGILKGVRDLIEDTEAINCKVRAHDRHLNGEGAYDGVLKRLKVIEDQLEDLTEHESAAAKVHADLEEFKRTNIKDTQEAIEKALKPLWTVMEKKIDKDLADVQFKHILDVIQNLGREKK
jgi:hypothetical protein